MTEHDEHLEDANQPNQSPPQTRIAWVQEVEPDHLQHLGLGRGVDCTDEKMWLNQPIYNVRNVSKCNVETTDEGGRLNEYSEIVTSVSDLQLHIKPSVNIPNTPITIGIDAEYGRKRNTTYRTVGRKVLNRKVAFSARSEDSDAFMGSLWKYVSEKLQCDENDKKVPTEEIITRHERDVVSACKMFLREFRVTHYVHTIELGAAEYYILSKREYEQQVEGGGNIGIEHLSRISSRLRRTFRRQSTLTAQQRIGRIGHDNIVERNGEAVIAINILPLSTLVTEPTFQAAVKASILEYVEEKKIKRIGPFVMKCIRDGAREQPLFWKVNNQQVRCTDDFKEASPFYVIPSTGDENQFQIAHYGDDVDIEELTRTWCSTPKTQREPLPIPYYLTTNTDCQGRQAGPLRVKMTAEEENTRFVLHSRLYHRWRNPSQSIKSWVDLTEPYYINCCHRFLKINGYICVVESPPNNYITSCVRKIEPDKCMLFQLQHYSNSEH